jgi:hypothetical protein
MSAKNLVLKPITSKEANAVIKDIHYSGKVVNNSQFHIGVYYGGKLEGAMQFGPSLDKRKIQGLVSDTAWNGFLELNRMAFSEALPSNSESRAISIAMKLLKKHAPKVEWIVSFADGTQCGDGTIYRASGFVLTGINKSTNLARLSDGSTIHKMTLESNPKSPRPELNGKSYYEITGGKYDFKKYVQILGAEVLTGFQLRYIYFLNNDARNRLTVPVIPFSEIAKQGATMYRGKRPDSVITNTSSFHDETGGVNPTSGLQTKPVESDHSQ